jgi:hypothetical protein
LHPFGVCAAGIDVPSRDAAGRRPGQSLGGRQGLFETRVQRREASELRHGGRGLTAVADGTVVARGFVALDAGGSTLRKRHLRDETTYVFR